MKKVNLLDKTGVLKLKDDLTMDYGMYIQEQGKYIELTEKLNELIGEYIYIRIVDVKTNKELFNCCGLLDQEKLVSEDFYIDGNNLSDILWYLTETKIRLVLDAEENKNEREGKDK